MRNTGKSEPLPENWGSTLMLSKLQWKPIGSTGQKRRAMQQTRMPTVSGAEKLGQSGGPEGARAPQ
jgi:hypothetical protein